LNYEGYIHSISLFQKNGKPLILMTKTRNQTQLGKYATADEAARTKNAPLIALLKKLDVKVVTKL
jgi:hypothetical protein